MDKRIYQFLDKLFCFAEKVAKKFDSPTELPITSPSTREPEPPQPTIRFSNEDQMVEGELFK